MQAFVPAAHDLDHRSLDLVVLSVDAAQCGDGGSIEGQLFGRAGIRNLQIPLGQRGAAGNGVGELGVGALAQATHHRREECLFTGEVVQETTLGDLCFGGDCFECHLGDSHVE